ncbi:hypothetical protein [Tolypothrix sp. VBCCA 56010]|uniref:hypothetical protein n=1 Tax=Tolypothrix sp. VBCCA 56010 TaxID=3137731 RepID=UPI003D7EC79E
MDLNTVLEMDNAEGSEALIALDAIATQLEDYRAKYPNTFSFLCGEGRRGSDFTLVDAASALADACEHVAEGE